MLLVTSLLVIIGVVTSQEWLPCDIVPVPGCSCWDPERPLVECHALGLTKVPSFTTNMSDIHTLKLTANRITRVGPSALGELTNLRRLSLEGNLITVLDTDCFDGVEERLTWLDLRDNSLRRIPPALSALTNVKKLYLSGNKILALKGDSFSALQKLEELYLDRNSIKYVSMLTFSNTAPTLWSVTLGLDRSLRFNDIGPSRALSHLESLSISGSNSRSIRNVQSWLAGFARMRHLELRDVNMTQKHLSKNCFGVFKNRLESLSLKDNNIRKMPMGSVKGLMKLTTLDLSGNNIKLFAYRRGWRRFLGQLQRINLSNNSINRIDRQVWASMRNATLVDIRNNHLEWTDLTSDIVNNVMKPYVLLEVGGNPWVCDCRNLWLRELIDMQLRTGSGHLLLWEIYHDIRCHGTGPNANLLMKDVPKSDFSCDKGLQGNALEDLLPEDRYLETISDFLESNSNTIQV